MSKKPKCILVTGQLGAGKTTLAKQLGQHLWMPVIVRDEIKEGYVNTFGVRHDQLSPDINGLVTELFFDIIHRYLVGQISVVIEAAFQHSVWEKYVSRLQELASLRIVSCTISDETAAYRHLQRGLENPRREFYHGDKRVTHYRQTGEFLPPPPFTPPKFDIPTIHVVTAGEYIPSLVEVVQQLQSLQVGDT